MKNQISIRLNPKVEDEVRSIAKREKISISNTINEILKNYLKIKIA